jgi:dsRNA-specific ribonuclease
MSYGKGRARSKKSAEQKAAREALEKLQEEESGSL